MVSAFGATDPLPAHLKPSKDKEKIESGADSGSFF